MSLLTRTLSLVAATALTTATFASLATCARAAPGRVYALPAEQQAPAVPARPACDSPGWPGYCEGGTPVSLPVLDAESWCAPGRDARGVAVCVKGQQYAYDNLKFNLWDRLTPAGQRYCTGKLGGDRPVDNYQLIEACAVGRLGNERNWRDSTQGAQRFRY